MRALRLYWEVARRSYRRFATYRWATAAGVFTNSVFGFVRAYIFKAVYEVRPVVGRFDAFDAVTYAFLTQGMIMAVALFGRAEISERIRTGDIVTDFYRPVDFQAYHLAADLGRAAFHTLFRGIPPILAGAAVFGLRLPPDVPTAFAFLVSLFLAVVISFGLRFLVDLTSFWLLDSAGVTSMMLGVAILLSGMAVPLFFFPGPLETLARALPWASMVQIPAEIFLGDRQGVRLAEAFALQLVWAVALLGTGRAVLAAAYRKVVVQGG